jgi:hypothetical protein
MIHRQRGPEFKRDDVRFEPYFPDIGSFSWLQYSAAHSRLKSGLRAARRYRL